MKFTWPWSPKPVPAEPTALQLAVRALEECRKDQLEQAHKAEYHAAMADMLEIRENRLIVDITRLSNGDSPQHGTGAIYVATERIPKDAVQ